MKSYTISDNPIPIMMMKSAITNTMVAVLSILCQLFLRARYMKKSNNFRSWELQGALARRPQKQRTWMRVEMVYG